MNNILKELRKELKSSVDEKTKETAQHYFKEKIKFYGVKVPLSNKIAAAFYKKHIEKLNKADTFELCAELWKSGYIEESFVACSWSYSLRDRYEKKDFTVFESWLTKYVNNWASCDTLCNHTIAEIVEMYPELIKELKKWARSDNRWVKRGAAVTLIIPAKKGLFMKEIFEIADILLTDEDDMVQKGYGWMLKAGSKAASEACQAESKAGAVGKADKVSGKAYGSSAQKEVFDYVMKNKSKMPRTALRYAIEKMPAELKKKAMAR